MNFSDLCEIVTDLKLEYPNRWTEKILGPTSIDYPIPGHFIFIGDAKFLASFENTMGNPIYKKMGIIVDRKLYEAKKELFTSFEENIAFLVTTSSITQTIFKISKPFYNAKYADINNMVDGRQMGTAKVHPTASIAQNVFLGEDVEVGEGSVIHSGTVIMGKSKVGKNTTIYPNVNIYSFVNIGDNCRVHSGTIIGTDGFGYVFDSGVHNKIWHFGGVNIADDVEIGGGTTIDSGTFSPTVIGKGSKIDNQVQIAHNDILGIGVIMCGQSGLAGTVKVGNYCVLGGKAGVVNGVEIADGTQIGGASVVTASTKPKDILAGHPARPVKDWLRSVARLRQLSRK